SDMTSSPVGARIRASAFETGNLSESHVLSMPNYPLWRNRPAVSARNAAMVLAFVPAAATAV
ncbi:MAG: hypothetical protein JWN86_3367, partial [Planctomycetota bacterium]|nr:hypothetical protein [Planctomycetota bacterium]